MKLTASMRIKTEDDVLKLPMLISYCESASTAPITLAGSVDIASCSTSLSSK